ncbi:MAG: diguanylate cyclase [Rhizobium sp.]|nr:diguanylate cyclase [Rhizobium sp.]
MAGTLRRLFDRLRPRSAGLRTWLGLTYGLMTVVLVGTLSYLVERAASQKLQDDIGLRLQANALALADHMDEGLYERLNDMRALALLPGVDDPVANQALLRDLFDLMQLNYPDYAWIGVADADGRVQVASRGLLEGVDVSSRPWFQSGRREPHVGNLHEVVLLAKLLPSDGDEPLRLIDISAPIHDDHGVVIGVMGAHLSWQWAENLRQALVQPMLATDPVEVFFLDKDNTIILGPPPWRGQRLDVPSAQAVREGRRGSVLETWPDGQRYLTGHAPTLGRDPFDSLGWTVLVRKDAALAFEPIAELRRQILLAAAVLTLVFLLLGGVMGRLIGAPLHSLSVAARRMQAREPGARFPRERGYREARELTGALRGLVDDLTQHERELTQVTAELEQRVRQRTLELSDANAQLEVLAMTDALTGLANRRHFGDQLAREANRAGDTGRPLSLCVLDIDHFKAINDQHGHPAGDAVLRRVALVLEEVVRGSDLLARIGGEEFAVLAVDTGMAEAAQLAERLRAAVERAGPVTVGHAAVSVTVSVGVVTRRVHVGEVVKAPEHLLAAADDALYRAKRNGRNRVEVATG